MSALRIAGGFLLDFLVWLYALLRQWIALLGGAFVSIVMLIDEHLQGQPISWDVLKRVIAITLAVAAYLAWREQDRRAGLCGKIEQLVYGGVWPFDSGRLMVMVFMTIKNLPPGDQTIVDSYTLRVKSSAGETDGQLEYIGHPKTVTMQGTDGQSIKYGTGDFLYSKTKPTPIQSGASETGLLPFSISASDKNILDGDDLVFIVEFADVRGHKYKAVSPPRPRGLPSDKLMHFPGTQPL